MVVVVWNEVRCTDRRVRDRGRSHPRVACVTCKAAQGIVLVQAAHDML